MYGSIVKLACIVTTFCSFIEALPISGTSFVFPVGRDLAENAPDNLIYFRVPNTNTLLGVTPIPRHTIDRQALRKTLENCQFSVRNAIKSHGDGPFNRYRSEPYIYPAPGTPHTGVGLEFESFSRQSGMLWSEVEHALYGLIEGYYDRGYYEEATFIIFEEKPGEKLRKEGEGRIFSQPRPGEVFSNLTTLEPTTPFYTARSLAESSDIETLNATGGAPLPGHIAYRVPNTHTYILIIPSRLAPMLQFKRSLDNCRAAVNNIVEREGGERTLSSDRRDPYFYPPSGSRYTGVGFQFKSVGSHPGALKWKEVQAALIGITAALYNRGIFVEAYFEIYNDEGIPRQDGEGWIFRHGPQDEPLVRTAEDIDSLTERSPAGQQPRDVQEVQNTTLDAQFFYRVPNTNTILGINTRRPVPGPALRHTLENVKIVVENRLRREGDGPILRNHQNPYVYSPKYTGIGMKFESVDQAGKKLTWREVDNALLGLIAVLIVRENYAEAFFTIYTEFHQLRLEEGSGSIFSSPESTTTTPEKVDIPPGTIFPADEDPFSHWPPGEAVY
ncbi:MAG: hypothetical protein LQ342_005965 [Letrouitia transgressa]|nr:MAG: hypothetical protein LQ342_005965 [Letrouitia transgressa]